MKMARLKLQEIPLGNDIRLYDWQSIWGIFQPGLDLSGLAVLYGSPAGPEVDV